MRIGGDKFDEAIINYVRRNYGMLIGEATAERIKMEIGSAFPGSEVREMAVKGRNLSEGVPRSFTINSNEILEALHDPLQSIVSAVKKALEQTPPELGADIAERGMVLTGGGALLRDLDRLLTEETGLPVRGRRRPADLRGARRRPHPGADGQAGPGTFRPRVAQGARKPKVAAFGTGASRPLRRGWLAGFRFTVYAVLSVVLHVLRPARPLTSNRSATPCRPPPTPSSLP